MESSLEVSPIRDDRGESVAEALKERGYANFKQPKAADAPAPVETPAP